MRMSARVVLLLSALGVLFSAPASAFMQISDTALPEYEADFRPGGQPPGKEQRILAKSLQATVRWNRYGTVHSMMRQGGFLATGLAGTPAEAARNWIRQNRSLFKLSDAGVDDLELVNEGVMPHTPARAVLFRQRFGGLRVAHDGLINVGIVDGKVYYVSSSSAGDQPPPGAATLTPMQAWLKAAANINRFAKAADIGAQRDATAQSGWNLFQVLGFSQEQRARLVAIPMPAGGVRQAYQTIVVDLQDNGLLTAYVHFIDAETGAVLRRENRVQNLDAGAALQPFSGSMEASSCGPRHSFTLESGSAFARISVTPVVPSNALAVRLYSGSQLLATRELAAGGGTFDYSRDSGLAAGAYEVEVCPLGATALPPYNYVGTLQTSDSAAALLYGTARWRWFGSSPTLDYSGADNRLLACFGTDTAGCDVDVTNVYARQPWDMLLGLVPTFTTIGNAAITSGSALNPISGPSNLRIPLSLTRNYDYAFNNAWHKSGCSPLSALGSVIPVGNLNDIDASVVNLFVAHNRMHDWAYVLGFTERNYNMQLSNFGQTGLLAQNDPEIGAAQAGAVTGGFPLNLGRNNANQASLPDGVPGITTQYLFQPLQGAVYAPCTDGSFEMGIVGHEYTHAISNRMIGGPDQSIGGQQGASMGESWSDLSAFEHMYAYGYREGLASETAMPLYVAGGDGAQFRNFPIGESPLNYSNFGYDSSGPEAHADGEIWNATQWSVRQAMVDQWEPQFPYRDMTTQQRCADDAVFPEACPGNRRWIQLIFDSFLLMPAAPSMLDARDAMLAADLARFGGANQKSMWHGFAARGMGRNAYSDGGDDLEPVPSFESPLEDNAVVTVRALAEDGRPIAKARVYIGQFATRSRPVADTDPATVADAGDEASLRASSNRSDTFSIVPGSYDLIVEAPGYGQQRYTRSFKPGAVTLSFTLPENLAALGSGAVVGASASLPQNQALKDSLIDETENTGAVFGDVPPIAGSTITVQLAGGEHTVSRVHISAAGGPDNPGRFNALRAFEIRTCSGACSDPLRDFDNVAYVSAADAFPGVRARPLAPKLNMRAFDFPPVRATHVQLRVLTSQCTGNPDFAGEQDKDPLNPTDCPSSDIANDVRATEFQVFAHAAEAPAETDKGGPIESLRGRFGGAMPGATLLGLLAAALMRRRRCVSE